VFASKGIAERVSARALNDINDWGTSDHRRGLIEFTVPSTSRSAGRGVAMGSQSCPHEDYEYEQARHLPGTNGYNDVCTERGCGARPEVSRHWLDAERPWWGAYCKEHADLTA
jgi:hypothetical protein